MFVKKFEADTLEEALKAVKFELGPDAIILKTITNSGLKGAFKKKRIEITAAISERSFEKKAKVDKVLNNDQKEALYQKSASSIKETITKYNGSQNAGPNAGYGSIGLNKVVNTLAKGTASLADVTNKTSSMIKNSLDDFLTDGEDSGFESDSNDDEPVTYSRPVKNHGKYSEPPQMAPTSRARPAQSKQDVEDHVEISVRRDQAPQLRMLLAAKPIMKFAKKCAPNNTKLNF